MLTCISGLCNGIFRLQEELGRAWCLFRGEAFWLVAVGSYDRVDSHIWQLLADISWIIAGYRWSWYGEQQQPCKYWEAREWGRKNLKQSKTILNFIAVGETWLQGWTSLFELQLLLKKRCPYVIHISSPSLWWGALFHTLCVCLFFVLPLHRSGQKIKNLGFYHFLTYLLCDRGRQCCASNSDVKEKTSGFSLQMW